ILPLRDRMPALCCFPSISGGVLASTRNQNILPPHPYLRRGHTLRGSDHCSCANNRERDRAGTSRVGKEAGRAGTKKCRVTAARSGDPACQGGAAIPAERPL